MGTKKNQSAGPQQMKKIQGTDYCNLNIDSVACAIWIEVRFILSVNVTVRSIFKKCQPLFTNLGAYKFRHCGLSNDMRVDWRGRVENNEGPGIWVRLQVALEILENPPMYNLTTPQLV